MELSAIIMGQRVRAARQAKKMKTEELAEKVNIAVESIGHIAPILFPKPFPGTFLFCLHKKKSAFQV